MFNVKFKFKFKVKCISLSQYYRLNDEYITDMSMTPYYIEWRRGTKSTASDALDKP